MNVLVVAAHPDDEVLGCGGTIAQLARAGQTVHLAVLGEGITARYAQREQADPKAVDGLQHVCRQVATMLGAEEPFLHHLPDNRFDTVPLLDVVKLIEGLVERVCPEIIYTHHSSDLNVDHEVVHRAVLTATRPVPGQCVREIYAFEVPSSTEWGFNRSEPPFRPNVFVDIAATLDLKIRALSRYASEIRPFPHPRSPEALRALANRWGSVVGCKAAEAFELVRAIR